MLGDWEVPHIEEIGSLEQRRFVEYQVPGQAQPLYQDLSATPTRIAITGSLYGDEDRDAFLQEVRGKFQAGEPLTFVADIVTATELQYVVIEQLRFEQSATRPDEISYQIRPRPESGLSIATTMIFPVSGQSERDSGSFSRSSSLRAFLRR